MKLYHYGLNNEHQKVSFKKWKLKLKKSSTAAFSFNLKKWRIFFGTSNRVKRHFTSFEIRKKV